MNAGPRLTRYTSMKRKTATTRIATTGAAAAYRSGAGISPPRMWMGSRWKRNEYAIHRAMTHATASLATTGTTARQSLLTPGATRWRFQLLTGCIVVLGPLDGARGARTGAAAS